MSEGDQRRRVIRALKPLHAVAIESRVGIGIPDVNYIDGWIELKWARRWPESENTILRVSHFTLQQARWLRRRWNLGGRSWLLLQVQQEWLLFKGCDAGDCVGKLTRAELQAAAHAYWPTGLDEKELITCLKQNLGVSQTVNAS